MNDHDMIQHAVKFEDVPVPVDVVLILAVVVGPGNLGLLRGEDLQCVDGHLTGSTGIVRVANIAGRSRLAAVRRVIGLGMRHHQPRCHRTCDFVSTARHLVVHVEDGVTP